MGKMFTKGSHGRDLNVMLRLTVILPWIVVLFAAMGGMAGFVAGRRASPRSEEWFYHMWPWGLWLVVFAWGVGYGIAYYMSARLKAVIRRMDRLIPVNKSVSPSIPGTEVDVLMEAANSFFPAIEGKSGKQPDAARARRLMELGFLTSGIVHEFRNPLGSMLGLLELLEEKIPAESPGREYIERIKAIGERLNRMVLDVLDFARPGMGRLETCSINDLIEQAVAEVADDLRSKGITFEKNLSREMVEVEVVPEQVLRVILNLFVNAMEATDKGGVISCMTWSNKEKVFFSVTNSGPSVDEEIKDSIFDPFVTTKGTGCGLGLSIAYRIIQAHGGDLRLAGSGPEGTTFEFTLPIKGKRSRVEGREVSDG